MDGSRLLGEPDPYEMVAIPYRKLSRVASERYRRQRRASPLWGKLDFLWG